MTIQSCSEKDTCCLVHIIVEPSIELVDTYQPFVHHFSSTGCGPCGRWGVPIMRKVELEMGDSIFPMITHFKYEDPFITNSSQAIEDAILTARYSPQIWIENENITYDILGTTINSAANEVKKRLRAHTTKSPEVKLGIDAVLNAEGRFDVTYAVSNMGIEPAIDSQTYFVEIYSMEDSLIASQAGADPYVSTHFNVNRGGFYGDMGLEIMLGIDDFFEQTIEVLPCWKCVTENMHFNMVVWRKKDDGTYEYVNGIVKQYK